MVTMKELLTLIRNLLKRVNCTRVWFINSNHYQPHYHLQAVCLCVRHRERGNRERGGVERGLEMMQKEESKD